MMPVTRKHVQCTPEVCISRDVYCPGWEGNYYDVNSSFVPEKSAMEESVEDILTLSTEDRISDSDTPHSERSVSNESRVLLAFDAVLTSSPLGLKIVKNFVEILRTFMK